MAPLHRTSARRRNGNSHYTAAPKLHTLLSAQISSSSTKTVEDKAIWAGEDGCQPLGSMSLPVAAASCCNLNNEAQVCAAACRLSLQLPLPIIRNSTGLGQLPEEPTRRLFEPGSDA